MARGRALAPLLLIAAAGCRVARPPTAAPSAPPVAVSEVAPAPTASTVPAPAASAPSAPAAEAPRPAAPDEDLDDDDDGMTAPPHRPSPAPTSPLLALSDGELQKRWAHDKASLGSLSVGAPNLGLLINGVPMGESAAWVVLDPAGAYGTEETVRSIARIIERAHEKFPDTKPLAIGHISAQHGGHLSPHKSHQAGRDVDIAYYLTQGQRGLVAETTTTLSGAETWVMVKTALLETPVEMIFMDNGVQRLLVDHALAHGESPEFIDEVFLVRGKNPAAPIRHLHGHHNHFHVRFHSPNAEALAKRLSRVLPTPKRAPPPAAQKGHGHGPPPAGASYFELRARSGDTLVVWAKRYGVSVEEIQRANGLTGNSLKIGHVYRIPRPQLPQLPPPRR